jgi:hypothetical protein
MKRSSFVTCIVVTLAIIVGGIRTPLASARALEIPGQEKSPPTARLHPFKALCVNVGGTAGCEATISAAVALIAEKNAIINVDAGTYIDNVSINTGVKPKKLTLSINGTAGAGSTIIDGNAAGSVFTIGSKAVVTLDGLTIQNGTGQAIPPVSSIVGGGIFASGGTLTVSNCVISANHANFGAGIDASDETLTIANSLIASNTAPDPNASSGGGINFGAAKALELTITNSTIDSNSALDGGGMVIANSAGTTVKPKGTISGSTISNNTATLEAGGIFVETAKLTMTDSTISGNVESGAAGQGAGLLTATGDVTLNDVTIANNSAAGFGGGVDLDLNNKKFTFSNTIIAENIAPTSPDCSAFSTMISHDYNFIGDMTGCSVTGKTAHDLTGNPLLGPLQNNGGTTETQALLTGSPALGVGNPAKPNGGTHCEATDQIGTARVKGDCDIGAYQLPD